MAANNDIQEDFLEVDQKIPGQNFVCLSFISTDKVLKDKKLRTKLSANAHKKVNKYSEKEVGKLLNKIIRNF